MEMMEHRWTTELKLSASQPLREGWQQLQRVVIGSAASFVDKEELWSVVQLPTGAGKSQAVAVLCAQYEKRNHPGALIVTRFCKEADTMAELINKIADDAIAVASHSNNEVGSELMKSHPVLVITHSGFQMALRAAADGQKIASRMHDYRHWENGDRAWTIIDETPNFVETFSISLAAMGSMLSELQSVQSEAGLPGLASLTKFVGKVNATNEDDRKNRVLIESELDFLKAVDFASLKESVLGTPARHFTTGEHHKLAGADVRNGYTATLDNLTRLQSLGVLWKSWQRGVERLNGARLLFKHAGRRGVILDATATNDPIYNLIEDRVKLLPRPKGIRDYNNVRLYISRGHRIGKEHLTQNGKTEWARMRDTLKAKMGNGQSVLAICHKDNVPVLEAQGISDCNLTVTNWGAIDGKNDWAACDTAILFGLPYFDDVAPTNLYLGCRDAITDAWLSGERNYGDHTDIRQAIKDGFTIRSVLQGLNRVRCRHVVDAQGGCHQTDIYLMLPPGDFGDRIIRAIQVQMPRIQVTEWNVVAALPKVRRNRTLDRLVQHLKQLSPGTYTKSEVLKAAGIAKRSFERLSVKLQDSSSKAFQRMCELNVGYVCTIGTNEAEFVIS